MENAWKDHATTLARGHVPILCESRTRVGEMLADNDNLACFWAEFGYGNTPPAEDEIKREAALQSK